MEALRGPSNFTSANTLSHSHDVEFQAWAGSEGDDSFITRKDHPIVQCCPRVSCCHFATFPFESSIQLSVPCAERHACKAQGVYRLPEKPGAKPWSFFRCFLPQGQEEAEAARQAEAPPEPEEEEEEPQAGDLLPETDARKRMCRKGM